MLTRWAALLARRAGRATAALALLLGLAAALGAGVFAQLVNGGYADPGSGSARQIARTAELFELPRADVVAIYSSDRLTVDDPAFRAAVAAAVARVPAAAVTSIDSYAAAPPQAAPPGLVSPDRRATLVLVTLAGADDTAKLTHVTPVTDALQTQPADAVRADLGGPLVLNQDVNRTVARDLARAEAVALPVVFVLSLLVFRGLVAALMPVLVGGAAVVGSLAILRGVAALTDVSVFVVNVVTVLGMGLAVDYSLFVVSRFREELARPGATPGSAVVATLTTAGRTVLFSGLIVAVSMASLLVFPQVFLRSMGLGGMAAVLVAMTAALTILPAVLVLLGRRIDAGRLPRRRRPGPAAVDPDTGRWAALARAVMRRPWTVAIGSTLLLVVLSLPFHSVSWGGVDERALPADARSRIAADQVAEHFGGDRATARILLEGGTQAEHAAYRQQVAGLPGVTDVAVLAQRADATVLQARWSGRAQSPASQDLARAIRDVPVPAGTTAAVGGASAETLDLTASLGHGLPRMALFTALVMLVLLFVAFGSIVLPVKAIAVTVISLGASYGVVAWIFAHGHLDWLLGFTANGYLDLTMPVLMLAVVFGLSMDYEVFLLSRVREEWDRTGDNTAAVAHGLQRTGRIITSAALLLAVVIGAFSSSGIVFMKLLGVGMLVAVLLDATVVRALLVPATMRLLGRWNWWAPAPLARWWQRHGHRAEPVRGQPVRGQPVQPEPVDPVEPVEPVAVSGRTSG